MSKPSPARPAVLTINGGSSSIKFALYDVNKSQSRRRLIGQIERIGSADTTLVYQIGDEAKQTEAIAPADTQAAVRALADWLDSKQASESLGGVVHRIVHGGVKYVEPQRVTAELLHGLHELASIDPDHLPGEIDLIEVLSTQYPLVPQVVCFDTAFHHDLPAVAKILPLPRSYQRAGYRRFGFHGLSYQYLMKQLAVVAGESAANGRVVLAHLGSGASLAAVVGGKSVDTTMSYTPTAGLVMGTRCGDLDPGLLVSLMRTQKKTADELDELINRQSGLKGISETSSDTRDLLIKRATDPRAAEAIAVFCYQARKQIGAMAAAMGGLDTLVYSGGIGEPQPDIRGEICERLQFLGIDLDAGANAANDAVISRPSCPTTVRVMRTDEEQTLVDAAIEVLQLI